MNQETFRSPFRAGLWKICARLVRILIAPACRISVRGLDKLPAEGPAILAPNHISHFDPPVLSAVFRRPIDWVAMSELYGADWSRRFFLALNAIPIRRGTPDRSALREAANRLAAGRVVGLFPEGGLRDGAESVLLGARPLRGLGLLTRLTKAPVFPCAIAGTDRLYNWRSWLLPRRVPIWVVCGDALPTQRDDDNFSEALMAAFASLRETLESQMGVQPEDLPRSPQERMAEKSGFRLLRRA